MFSDFLVLKVGLIQNFDLRLLTERERKRDKNEIKKGLEMKKKFWENKEGKRALGLTFKSRLVKLLWTEKLLIRSEKGIEKRKEIR